MQPVWLFVASGGGAQTYFQKILVNLYFKLCVKPIRNFETTFSFSSIATGFTGKVVAVMHGANAPLMKVQNVSLSLDSYPKEI